MARPGFPAKNFGYDALDRLTGYTGGAITQTYKYDADGNRTSLAAGATTTYAIDAASNRLDGSTGAAIRTLTYDSAGNTTLDNRVVTDARLQLRRERAARHRQDRRLHHHLLE